MKKVEGKYGPEKTRISLNLNPAWKYFDNLNNDIDSGLTAQEVFVKAYEKVCDQDLLSDLIKRIEFLEKEVFKKED